MAKKKVVHISKTSLAGAPIRIVQALNKYTNYEARLVNFMPTELSNGEYVFDEDLNWQDKNSRNEAIKLIKDADIIHLHHFMDLEFYNPFLINFKKETKSGCKFLRHYHTDKEYIAKNDLDFNKLYPNDNVPSIVIPHYPERTFLDYPIVPNIIPIRDKDYMPINNNNDKIKVAFSVSNKNSYKNERWATKGYPEVSAALRDLSDKMNFEYIEISDMPLKNALQIKQHADIIVGDIVTGSYHLTELEGLSLGKPTLTYLDQRSVMTFINTFCTKDIPFVNVNLNNLECALSDIIQNAELRKSIGEFSRVWMEEYYDDKILINVFVDIYENLLCGKEIIRSGMDNYKNVKEFLYNRIYDYNWLSKKASN